MVPLGTRAPRSIFRHTVTGKNYSLDDLKGNVATVVMFICTIVPSCKHVNHELVTVANEYKNRGIVFAA
jgi:hypothetical protein